MSWEQKQDIGLGKLNDTVQVFKPNKDPTQVSLYRPISLISCLGKLYERLVNNILQWWVESNSLLPNHQCGFRADRSTTYILLQLEQQIYKGFRENKNTLVIYFDLNNAFDRASHTGILYKICTVGLRGNCLYYLNNFFHGKRV